MKSKTPVGPRNNPAAELPKPSMERQQKIMQDRTQLLVRQADADPSILGASAYQRAGQPWLSPGLSLELSDPRIPAAIFSRKHKIGRCRIPTRSPAQAFQQPQLEMKGCVLLSHENCLHWAQLEGMGGCIVATNESKALVAKSLVCCSNKHERHTVESQESFNMACRLGDYTAQPQQHLQDLKVATAALAAELASVPPLARSSQYRRNSHGE